MSVGATRSPSLTTNLAICLTLMTYLLFSESFSSCIILVHLATCRGWSSDMRCRSAGISHRCGGARPVSDSCCAAQPENCGCRRETYLDPDLLINARLLLLDLFLKLLQAGCVRRCAIGFEHPDIPMRKGLVDGLCLSNFCPTYSSDRGLIFFSGSSSSANSFVYLSQFWPVALGILTVGVQRPKV